MTLIRLRLTLISNEPNFADGQTNDSTNHVWLDRHDDLGISDHQITAITRDHRDSDQRDQWFGFSDPASAPLSGISVMLAGV